MISVTIITPTDKRTLEVVSLTFDTRQGSHTWLAGHEPAMSLIKEGSTIILQGIDGSEAQERLLVPRGGVCLIDRVTVTAVLYA